MPKSFLFTNRRYNNETCPLPLTDPVSRSSVSSSVCCLSGTLSPDQASEAATASSPARPQAARMTSAPLQVPEEMYNLLQLAEVSLATSGTSNPSILERWREEWARMTLKNSKVSRNLSADFRIMDQEFSVLDYEPPLEKPLDLSRDHSEVRILTPSPSPAPSIASSDNLEIHIPDSTDLKKGFESESSNDTTSISSKSTASKHSEHHEGHECPECGKRYSTSSNLARHRQTHRSPADQKARRCPHCDKVYVSVPAFSMHVRTHSQGCKCPYCGKAFSRPWLLQGHIRTHTGEKPFRCQVCEKAFADKSNLRAHVQTHSNLKPYVCERCGKAFALKSYLYKHEESSCMKTSKTKA